MTLAGPALPLVFAAGVVSFASPCVLPLVPAYLATISGAAIDDAAAVARRPALTRSALRASLLFFAGFLLVFVSLGASASVLGALLASHRLVLNRIAGVLIVVFGAALLGVGWSSRVGGYAASRVTEVARRRGGPVALGVAFAFCWTPCIGPVLGAVLTLAGASASLGSGVVLLGVYGLGLATPFLLTGLGFVRVMSAARRLRIRYRVIQRFAGVMLMVMGLLLVSDRLYVVNAEAQRLLSTLGLDWWTQI